MIALRASWNVALLFLFLAGQVDVASEPHVPCCASSISSYWVLLAGFNFGIRAMGRDVTYVRPFNVCGNDGTMGL
jgi:hypothetical protein